MSTGYDNALGTGRSAWRSDPLRSLTATLVILAAAGLILAAFWFRPIVLAAGIGGLAAMALIVFPRIAAFVLLGSVTVYMPQFLVPQFSLHPFDMVFALAAAGLLLSWLLRVNREIRHTPFDLPLLLLMGAALLSAVCAHDPSFSVGPLVRLGVLFLAYRFFYKYAVELGPRPMLLFFTAAVLLHSLWNIYLFAEVGGALRIFGLARLGFETLAMISIPTALAFVLWSSGGRQKTIYSVAAALIGVALLATQSRAPVLAVLIGVGALLYAAVIVKKNSGEDRPLRQFSVVILPLGGLLLLAFLMSQTLFAGSVERLDLLLQSFGDPQGTVAFRLMLWQTALEAFVRDPLTGVGIGNFRLIHEIYPTLRILPDWWQVQGFSAHNVVLHFLAETGPAGPIALILLAYRGIQTSLRNLKAAQASSDGQVAAALFAAMIVFAATLLFMRVWTWGQEGYILAFLLGLTAAQQDTLKQLTPGR